MRSTLAKKLKNIMLAILLEDELKTMQRSLKVGIQLSFRKLEVFQGLSIGSGRSIGILLFVPVFAVIQSYMQLHMDTFMQMLQNIK